MKSNRFKIMLHTAKGQFEELVSGESIELGRNVSADLPVMASGVSRSHLQVYVQGENILIKDLGATNGTYIKGQRIEPHKEIKYEKGARISLGQAGCFIRIEIAPDEVKIEDPHQGATQITFANRNVISNTQIKSSMDETGIIGNLGNIFGKFKNPDEAMDYKSQKRAKKYMEQAEKLVKQRISDAEGSIRKGIQKARIQAKDIVNDAKKEADTIKAKAQVEKNRMLADLEEEISSQKMNVQKELSDQKIKQDTEVQILRQEAEANKKEVEILLKSAQADVEKLKNKQGLLKEEIKDFLEKKNKARQDYKEVELKLSTIDEKHEAKSNALNLELGFLKQEILKQTESLESLNNKQSEELKNHEEALEALLSRTEETNESLDTASVEFEKISHQAEVLKENIEENEIQLKHKKIELSESKEKVELLLMERDRLEDDLLKTKENSEQHLADLKKEAEQSVEEIKMNALKEAEGIIQDAESLKKEVVASAKEIKANALKEADRLIQVAKEKEKATSEELRALKKSALEEKDQFLLEAKNLKKKAEASAKEIKVNALKEADRLIQVAKEKEKATSEELRALKESALEEKDQFLLDAKSLKKKASNLKDQAQADYDARMKDFEDFKALELSTLEAEIKSQKSEAQLKLEKELAESKVMQTRRIEKDVEEQKRVLHAYRAEYAESWSQSIVFKAQELFAADFTETQKEDLREKLKSYTKSIIMEEDPDEEAEVQNLMKFNPKHREKVKKFWKRSAAVAVMGLFALAVSPYVSDSIKEKAQLMAEKSSQKSKDRVAKFEEERDRLKTYVPEKRDEYLSNYTDRVLYTSNYVENELSKEYREEWFLNLDTFFVEDLILSDETIVTFISKETNLIKDLKELRESINAQFLNEGVKRMRELEQKFVFEVKDLLKTEGKYKQFENFKEEAYLKAFPFDGDRSLATEKK